MDEVTRADGWVVDGNYFGRLGPLVLERADLVVWLDPPLPTILVRLVRRTIARARSREDLWGTNRETWRNAVFRRDSLFVWAVRQHRRWRSRERAERLGRFPHVRLRSAREAEEWLAGFAPRAAAT